MTTQNFNVPTPRTTIKTIITDAEGNELESFVWEEKTTILPDGTINTERTNYGKILEGDTYYDPLMGKGPKPIRIGACYFCRHKASSKKSKSKKKKKIYGFALIVVALDAVPMSGALLIRNFAAGHVTGSIGSGGFSRIFSITTKRMINL